MSRHAIALPWLLVSCTLIVGACSVRKAPPKEWYKNLNIAPLSASCIPLVGRAGHIELRAGREVVLGDEVLGERTTQTAAVKLPSEILRLRPRSVSISPVDVDIRLGRYPLESGGDDYWGVVCSSGSFRNAFQKRDGTTFLTKLADHLWYYDGVM